MKKFSLEFLNSINSKRVEDLISICWTCSWMVRILLIQICLSLYSNSGGQLNEERGFYYYAYSVLVRMGSVYREFGVAGILVCSIFFGMTMFHPKFPYLADIFRAQVSKREFVVFLTDATKSKQMIAEQLNKYLLLTMSSNLQYTQSILCLLMGKSQIRERYLPDQIISEIGDGFESPKEQLDEFNLEIENCIRILSIKDINSEENKTARRLIEGLRRQYKHLHELWESGEKSPCWPINRSHRDRKQMSREFLLAVSLFTICAYNMAIVVIALTQSWAYTELEGNQNLPDEWRKYSLPERFMIVEQFLFCTVAVYWCVSPVAMFLVVLKNQIKLLKDLESKFEQFRTMVYEFDSFKRRQPFDTDSSRSANKFAGRPKKSQRFKRSRRLEQTFQPGSMVQSTINDGTYSIHFGQINYNGNEEIEEDQLRFKCDKLSLEIYISLRMFLEQIDGPVNHIKLIGLSGALFVGYSLFSTVICLRDTSSYQFIILLIATGVLIFSINTFFGVSAILSTVASKLVKRSFSMFALTLGERTSGNDADQCGPLAEVSSVQQVTSSSRLACIKEHHEQRFRRHRQPNYMGPSFARQGPMNLTTLDDIEHLLDNPTSPHTSLLWRRLVKDIKPLQNKMICRVAEFISLDFRSLLRVNFWIVSVILIALTWKSSDFTD